MSKKQLLRIGDPMLFSTLNPGFGMEKSASGINMPDNISESCSEILDQQHCEKVKNFYFLAVSRIRDILIRIRIWDTCLRIMDSAPDAAVYIIDFQDANKNLFFSRFSAYFTF
jgi:hypothetical protein